MAGRDALSAFLAAEAGRPPEPCHMIVLRWHEQVTGIACGGLAPAPEHAETIGLYRGMVRACRCLKLPETQRPRRGDVGLFRVPGFLMAGICTGAGWAARAPRGIAIYRTAQAFRAWSLA